MNDLPPGLFDKVVSGQEITISAQVWNAFIDAALEYRYGKDPSQNPSFSGRSPGIIRVRNDSAQDFSRFDVVGLNDIVIDPSDNLNEFQRAVIMSAVVPVTGMEGNWAILLEPIAKPNGSQKSFGAAMAAGVMPVMITAGISDPVGAFAEISNGATDLVFSATGSAKVLWAEATGTDRWAVVRIGGAGSGSSILPVSFARIIFTDLITVSIPSGTWTTVDWAGANDDTIGTDNYWDGHTKMIVPNDASDPTQVYTASAGGSFASNSTGSRGIRFRVNGTALPEFTGLLVPAVNGHETSLNITTGPFPLTASNDGSDGYVEVQVYQDSGGALNFTSISFEAFFAILRIQNSGTAGDGSDIVATVASDATNATSTFSSLSDLSVTIEAGAKYVGRMSIRCVNTVPAEGIKFDLNGGSATMTDFWAGLGNVANGGSAIAGTTVATSLSGAMDFATITGACVFAIDFSLTCNAGGTLIPRFAEDSHSTGTATVNKGTNIWLKKVT